MGALSTFVDELIADLSAFGVLQGQTAWLAGSIDADDLTVTVEAQDSVGQGVAEIGDEQVYIKRFDSVTNAVTFAPDGRGWAGTTAASHASGARMNVAPRFPRKSVEAAINRTIARTYPTIWGVATTNLTVVGGQATYELPATTEAVTSVSAESLGPSGVWYPIRDWTFDGHADTTAYPSGKTITIPGGIYPGRTVQVTYRTKPISLTSGHSAFTDCGLRESAKTAVRWGALADLLRTSDPMRLTSHSAAADEYDSKRGYGTATKIANDLEASFVRELDAERSRLRALYPPTIHRKRF